MGQLYPKGNGPRPTKGIRMCDDTSKVPYFNYQYSSSTIKVGSGSRCQTSFEAAITISVTHMTSHRSEANTGLTSGSMWVYLSVTGLVVIA